MIAGTLRSGKCFRHSSFRFPNRDIHRPTEQALKGSSLAADITDAEAERIRREHDEYIWDHMADTEAELPEEDHPEP